MGGRECHSEIRPGAAADGASFRPTPCMETPSRNDVGHECPESRFMSRIDAHSKPRAGQKNIPAALALGHAELLQSTSPAQNTCSNLNTCAYLEIRAELRGGRGRRWPTLGQMWSKSGQSWPTSAQIGKCQANLDNVAPSLVELGQIWERIERPAQAETLVLLEDVQRHDRS